MVSCRLGDTSVARIRNAEDGSHNRANIFGSAWFHRAHRLIGAARGVVSDISEIRRIRYVEDRVR